MKTGEFYSLLEKFVAIHGWRYRYVARTWFTWRGDRWDHLTSRESMALSLIGVAGELFPEGNRARQQVHRDYIVNGFIKHLVPHLKADFLPARVGPGDRITGSRPPSEPPAPADPLTPGQPPEQGHLGTDRSLEPGRRGGTAGTDGPAL